MVAVNWRDSLTEILHSEGGNDDDPQDHGGRTSRGITQREYNAWCDEKGQARGDVWLASQRDIEQIYHEEYWEPYCDLLPMGIDYLYFDMAVNAGPVRATMLLQEAMNVTVDGRIGPITRQAITRVHPEWLAEDYTVLKNAYYRSLHQPKFIRGWLNRAKEVHTIALIMIEKGNLT